MDSGPKMYAQRETNEIRNSSPSEENKFGNRVTSQIIGDDMGSPKVRT